MAKGKHMIALIGILFTANAVEAIARAAAAMAPADTNFLLARRG